MALCSLLGVVSVRTGSPSTWVLGTGSLREDRAAARRSQVAAADAKSCSGAVRSEVGCIILRDPLLRFRFTLTAYLTPCI
jgi:hypothetical protein